MPPTTDPNVGYCVMRNLLTLITQEHNFTTLDPGVRSWVKQVIGDFTVTGIPQSDVDEAAEYLKEHKIKAAA